MTRMWAVVGDATSSGGQVITGSPFTDIDGKPVARVNDKATCPTHKGTFPIIDGDPTTIIDGEAVALHGSSLACGCQTDKSTCRPTCLRRIFRANSMIANTCSSTR